MNRLALVFAVCLLGSASGAQAQDAAGAYISLGGGVNLMPHQNRDSRVAGSAAPEEAGQVSMAAGPALVAGIGRGLRGAAGEKGLRVEVEGSYRANGIRSDSRLIGESFEFATERKYGVMANAIFERTHSRIAPYAGGGIGGQFVHEPDTVSSSGGITVSIDGGTKSAFAYQFIAGARFVIRDTMSITADYRFLGLAVTRTFTGTVTIPGAGSLPFTDSSSHDYNHSVVVGIRCVLGG